MYRRMISLVLLTITLALCGCVPQKNVQQHVSDSTPSSSFSQPAHSNDAISQTPEVALDTEPDWPEYSYRMDTYGIQYFQVHNLADKALEDRINHTMLVNAVDWIPHGKNVFYEFDFYACFPMYKTNRYFSYYFQISKPSSWTSKSYCFYYNFDMQTGELLKLSDILRVDEELAEFIINGNKLKADIFVETTQEEADAFLNESINEKSVDEILSFLREMDEPYTKENFETAQERELEKLGFSMRSNAIYFNPYKDWVIGYSSFHIDLEDLEPFLKVEKWGSKEEQRTLEESGYSYKIQFEGDYYLRKETYGVTYYEYSVHEGWQSIAYTTIGDIIREDESVNFDETCYDGPFILCYDDAIFSYYYTLTSREDVSQNRNFYYAIDAQEARLLKLDDLISSKETFIQAILKGDLPIWTYHPLGGVSWEYDQLLQARLRAKAQSELVTMLDKMDVTDTSKHWLERNGFGVDAEKLYIDWRDDDGYDLSFYVLQTDLKEMGLWQYDTDRSNRAVS